MPFLQINILKFGKKSYFFCFARSKMVQYSKKKSRVYLRITINIVVFGVLYDSFQYETLRDIESQFSTY
jgi:hypothetical protein